MFTRRFFRLISSLALLVLLGQGGPAVADEMVSFATGGYASQLRTPEMMNKIDTNGDHVVSKSEWDAYQERLFLTLDVDKSNALDKAEFMSRESKPMVSFATGGFATALKTPEMWTHFDADHDGKISREEFLTYQGKIFDMMDTGKTHMLGQSEFFGRGAGNR
jgi:Ca2+-binding EF-hand superfamily protein